jgi:dipeptidase D
MEITSLSPSLVWQYFYEISQIPRPSKKEGKIIQYLKDFGTTHQLETLVDEVGNVLIRKNATKNNNSQKIIALQSHVDMVCEKNSGVVHNFDIDPIDAYVDGDWVKAKDTTLGADNGIGMAAMLAVLASDDIEHGKLECLFTIDEETGLTGAFALKENFLTADILLNLDSEDVHEIYIGCAGGIDTVAKFEYKKEDAPKDYFYFKITVNGLQGGHSGEDINKGLGNANKILTRYLWHLNKKTDLRICAIDGGNLRNAIAREAWAIAAVPFAKKEEIRVELNCFTADIESEFANTDPKVKLTLESENKADYCIDKSTSDRLLSALYACPHGVVAMSQEMTGMVETSTNLASVKKQEGNKIEITTSQRSSVESEKYDIMNTVENVFTLAGAKVEHGDGYPGWRPNPNSEIVKKTAECYERLFGEKAKIRAIHAGLECGLFLKKYPNLDMVSFGPTILYPHSPSEKVEIPSVKKFWKLLCEVLKS